MLAHVVPFQTGVSPPVVAIVPNTTCFVPSWVAPVWHSAHWIAFDRSVIWFACAMCAPTARCVVSVSPASPTGGAAIRFASAPATGVRGDVPWQLEHDSVAPHCGVAAP